MCLPSLSTVSVFPAGLWTRSIKPSPERHQHNQQHNYISDNKTDARRLHVQTIIIPSIAKKNDRKLKKIGAFPQNNSSSFETNLLLFDIVNVMLLMWCVGCRYLLRRRTAPPHSFPWLPPNEMSPAPGLVALYSCVSVFRNMCNRCIPQLPTDGSWKD